VEPALQVLPRRDQQRLDVDVNQVPQPKLPQAMPRPGFREEGLDPRIALPECLLAGGRPSVAADTIEVRGRGAKADEVRGLRCLDSPALPRQWRSSIWRAAGGERGLRERLPPSGGPS
jgi:hypothetical protein